MGRDRLVPLRPTQLSDAQRRVEQNFKRGFAHYNDNAYVQKHIASHLLDVFAQTSPAQHFPRALEIGCGTGFLTQELVTRLDIDHWTINDLVASSKLHIKPLLHSASWEFISGAIEKKPLPGNYSLIASSSVFQWIEELPKLLQTLSDNLAPGGSLVFSSFTKKHFHELRAFDAKPGRMSYYDSDELASLLPNDLVLKHIEQETHLATFDSVRKLLMHLRHTGVNANAQKLQWSRQRLATFEKQYQDQFADQDGKVGLTYAPVYVIAQKC